MVMKVDSASPVVLRRQDYTPPPFLVDTVDLSFDLRPEGTKVTAVLAVRRHPDHHGVRAPLRMDGADLELLEVVLDGAVLSSDQFKVTESELEIADVPCGGEVFQLATVVRIHPETNTALEGLYVSAGFYVTQCEAEGFRKITFFPDRPDVLARYTVTLEADRGAYPVLLSNGNPIDAGNRDGDRHFSRWEDPFPKPCYLFALVAGDLEHVEERYRTPSGREVTLRIYTESRNIGKCDHAMRSLVHSMRWDEAAFGLECDLDRYNVVVTDDFNMGAMENKGLNIFNSRYVLADRETATDDDFAAIEAVIGHEYFHNWTGNRVTCQDWFQLSLKEGLTVYRDQEFSGAMGSSAVNRIQNVRVLRNRQFPEDAGPMAHPVRPDEVIEINNFYTATVYEKGAEVVRMYRTLLGVEGFRKGMDLYFERHDGQAVTCDDFRAAMADANGRDLELFGRWYSQRGTPRLEVTTAFDPSAGTYDVTVAQRAAPDREHLPLHIPVAVGLLGRDGGELLENGEGQPGTQSSEHAGTRILELKSAQETFRFTGLKEQPVLSVLREFSAPVKLEFEQPADELAFRMAHDGDAWGRYDAAQTLSLRLLLELVSAVQTGQDLVVPDAFLDAVGRILAEADSDHALTAELLVLPTGSFVGDQMEVVDVDAIHRARNYLRAAVAKRHEVDLRKLDAACRDRGEFSTDSAAMGRRRLGGVCLAYLTAIDASETMLSRLENEAQNATNMTERLSAFGLLVHGPGSAVDDGKPSGLVLAARDRAVQRFYERFESDPLVMDKWLSVQVSVPRHGTLDRVRELMEDPVFSMRNPNKVRALVGSFCASNPVCFHAADGSGYEFLADRVIELDPLNPQVAARMVGIFNTWRRFDDARQALQRAQLARVLAKEGLSRDVFEIASKALGAQ